MTFKRICDIIFCLWFGNLFSKTNLIFFKKISEPFIIQDWRCLESGICVFVLSTKEDEGKKQRKKTKRKEKREKKRRKGKKRKTTHNGQSDYYRDHRAWALLLNGMGIVNFDLIYVM